MNLGRSSRSRKQHLPCDLNNGSLIEATTDIKSCYCSDGPDLGPPPRKKAREATTNTKSAEGRDKQSQLDHNEQERGRRRELAIVYEMIRTCVTEVDISYWLSGVGKCIDKLSYPQILAIAVGRMSNEQHDTYVYNKLVAEVKEIEDVLERAGVDFGPRTEVQDREKLHELVADVVEEALRQDKELRSMGGDYGLSQKEKAKEVDRKITQVLQDEYSGRHRSPVSAMNRERRLGVQSYGSMHHRPRRRRMRVSYPESLRDESPSELPFRNPSLMSTPESAQTSFSSRSNSVGNSLEVESSTVSPLPVEEERPGSTGSSLAAAPAQFDLVPADEQFMFLLDADTLRNNLSDDFFDNEYDLPGDLPQTATYNMEEDLLLQMGGDLVDSMEFNHVRNSADMSFDALFREID